LRARQVELVSFLLAIATESFGQARDPERSIESALRSAFTLQVMPPGDQTSEPRQPADAPRFAIRARGRYWRPVLEGDLRAEDDDVAPAASRIDVEEDLGIDSGDVSIAGIELVSGNHRLSFEAARLRFEGDETLRRTVVFRDTVFPVNVAVKSDVDLELFTGGYDYRVLRPTGFDLWIGPKAYVVRFDGSIEGRATGLALEESRRFVSGAPALSASVEARFGPVRLVGSAAAGHLPLDVTVIDLHAAAGLRLLKAIELDVGYRWLELDIDMDENDADLTLHGPTVSLGIAVRF
jgi:hypothetical protein